MVEKFAHLFSRDRWDTTKALVITRTAHQFILFDSGHWKWTISGGGRSGRERTHHQGLIPIHLIRQQKGRHDVTFSQKNSHHNQNESKTISLRGPHCDCWKFQISVENLSCRTEWRSRRASRDCCGFKELRGTFSHNVWDPENGKEPPDESTGISKTILNFSRLFGLLSMYVALFTLRFELQVWVSAS